MAGELIGIFQKLSILLALTAASCNYLDTSGSETTSPVERNDSSRSAPGLAIADEIPIPQPSDWIDYGPVIEAGPEGEWDFHWGGHTPCCIIQKDGIYYFYYVASDGYRSWDGEERHRAIGVATSQDGIHFTKYAGNPVMTFNLYDGEEEGANSAGIILDEAGNFVMFYGAAYGRKETIRSDVRYAISKDGFDFQDSGKILDHRNLRLYGAGDELFPLAAHQYQGNWYVFYEPNGALAARTLGLAWGTEPGKLTRSKKVLDKNSGGIPVGTWGNIVWLSPEKVALFIQRLWWPDTFIEVRTASPETPGDLSDPIVRYDIPDLKRGGIFLAVEKRTWFMYYNDFGRYWKVKLAPAGNPDTTPPTTPAKLSVSSIGHATAEISWEPASDRDTGVVMYNIYLDGIKVGNTKDFTFPIVGLSEQEVYEVAVTGVNFHGIEGPPARVTISTLPDHIPPNVLSVTSQSDPSTVKVVFDEPVDLSSAEDISNYSINPGIQVFEAHLEEDAKTLTLNTTPHAENRRYMLAARNISDRASRPNRMVPSSPAYYTFSRIADLVGYWNFDHGDEGLAVDLSGMGHDGEITGAVRQKAVWESALSFDQGGDYVRLPSSSTFRGLTDESYTFSVWVKPDGVPPKSNPYGILLRVGSHPNYYFGLSFNADRRFTAQIITEPNEELIALESDPKEPGEWHHLVMVVDDPSRSLHFFVDGDPVNGSPEVYTGTPIDLAKDQSQVFMAGEYYIGSTRPDQGAGSFFSRDFRGMIDEVRIYNRALSDEDIQILFQNTK